MKINVQNPLIPKIQKDTAELILGSYNFPDPLVSTILEYLQQDHYLQGNLRRLCTFYNLYTFSDNKGHVKTALKESMNAKFFFEYDRPSDPPKAHEIMFLAEIQKPDGEDKYLRELYYLTFMQNGFKLASDIRIKSRDTMGEFISSEEIMFSNGVFFWKKKEGNLGEVFSDNFSQVELIIKLAENDSLLRKVGNDFLFLEDLFPNFSSSINIAELISSLPAILNKDATPPASSAPIKIALHPATIFAAPIPQKKESTIKFEDLTLHQKYRIYTSLYGFYKNQDHQTMTDTMKVIDDKFDFLTASGKLNIQSSKREDAIYFTYQTNDDIYSIKLQNNFCTFSRTMSLYKTTFMSIRGEAIANSSSADGKISDKFLQQLSPKKMDLFSIFLKIMLEIWKDKLAEIIQPEVKIHISRNINR